MDLIQQFGTASIDEKESIVSGWIYSVTKSPKSNKNQPFYDKIQSKFLFAPENIK